MTIGNYSQLNMLGLGSGMNYQNFFSSCGMGSFNIGSLLNGGFGCGTSMYNCDGSYNYDKAAGMAVGGFLMSLVGGIANNAIAQKQANKTEAPEVKLEALQTKQANLEDAVETKTTAYKDAKTAYSKASEAFTENQAIIDKYDVPSDILNRGIIIKQYEEWKNSAPANRAENPPYTKDEYNEAVKIDTLLQNAIKKAESLEAAMKTAKTKVEDAEKALKAKQAELDEVNEEIESLEKDIKDAENQKILSKADGDIFTRTSSSKFNKKYAVDDNGKVTYSTTQDIEQGDLAYTLSQFQSAKPETKRKWALAFQRLYLDCGDKVPSKTQVKAYENIIEPWLKENKA